MNQLDQKDPTTTANPNVIAHPLKNKERQLNRKNPEQKYNQAMKPVYLLRRHKTIHSLMINACINVAIGTISGSRRVSKERNDGKKSAARTPETTPNRILMNSEWSSCRFNLSFITCSISGIFFDTAYTSHQEDQYKYKIASSFA